MKIHENEGRGDILAFLTGQEEIETVCKLVKEELERKPRRDGPRLKVLPMFAGLAMEQQMEVFEPVGRNTRKV